MYSWLIQLTFLAAPFVVCSLFPYDKLFLASYLVLSEVGIVSLLLKRTFGSQDRSDTDPSDLLLLIAFSLLLFADLIFSVRALLNDNHYGFIKGFIEVLYSSYAALLAAFFLRKSKLLREDRTSKMAAVILFLIYCLLVTFVILLPFEAIYDRKGIVGPIRTLLHVTNPFYSLAQAVIFSIALPMSMRVYEKRNYHFINAMLAFSVLDFALRYQMAYLGNNVFTFAQASNSASMGYLFLALIHLRGRPLLNVQGSSLANWNSIRCLLSIGIGLANGVVLLGLTSFFEIKNGFDYSLVFAILFFNFSFSNLISLRISSSCLEIASVMGSQIKTEEKRNEIRLEIPEIESQSFLDEVNGMIRGYNQLVKRSNFMIKQIIQKSKNEMMGEAVAQVAHDLRSPLSALNMIKEELQLLDEETRVLMKMSIYRLNDIANVILTNKENFLSQSAPQNKHSVSLITSLIDSLVTEKRVEYRWKRGLWIEAVYDTESYGLFSNINEAEVRRCLSNLMNNAVEAIEGNGQVRVDVRSGDSKILISISDTGKGMSEDTLQELGRQGFSVGKKSGSGLGIYNAKSVIGNCGGDLKFTSKIGQGTTATVSLPKCFPPQWFVSQIEVFSQGAVVVVDDDESIHRIWKKRIEPLKEKLGLSLFYFTDIDDFKMWHLKHSKHIRTLYLVDYEFVGRVETGLDLVIDLDIKDSSILVSSHFFEKDLKLRCLENGIRLVPKNLAPLVPIRSWCVSKDISDPLRA